MDKLQRDVCHYQKQLQEAHNVAMFQQALSVSPPRLGSGSPAPTTALPSVAACVVSGVNQAQNIVAIPSLTTPLSTVSCTSMAGILSPGSATASISQSIISSSSNVRLAGSSGGMSKTATLPAGSGRPQPPQLPAKPPQLSHQQTRLPGKCPCLHVAFNFIF